MRIISGKLKGRQIKLPKFFSDRPTTDFAKAGLFNTLDSMYYFEELRVLDLFAGSGSISYEFASRGVPQITLVEKNPKYVAFIRRTIREFFPDKVNDYIVVRDDVFDFIKERTLDYDIIFADPPYKMPGIDKLPDLIFANPTVRDDALVIIGHPKEYDFSNHPYFIRHKKYGHVNFSFFSKSKE